MDRQAPAGRAALAGLFPPIRAECPVLVVQAEWAVPVAYPERVVRVAQAVLAAYPEREVRVAQAAYPVLAVLEVWAVRRAQRVRASPR